MERVESGVVLICDGNNREGACDMLCLDVKMKCFLRDTTLQSWPREALEPRERKTCAEVSNARAYASGLSVVLTPRSLTKESPLPVNDITLI